MKLCTQTCALYSQYEPEEVLEILAGAGYDAADWSFFDMTEGLGPWVRSGWEDLAKRLKEKADSLGITIDQAHAPFPTTRGSEPYDTEIRRRIVRSMEAASLMGVSYIVVHPIVHLPYAKYKEELFEQNVEFYKSLIPECERLKIHVCAENMWQHDPRRGIIVDSICSQPEEFNALLDSVDSPWITGCLDIGHCALVGVEPQDFIRVMGGSRIKALHVQDVNYREDCHTMPYLESLNWDEITKALSEIGYQGDFTFECDNFINRFPKELMPAAETLMAETGRYLISKMGKAENK